MIKLHEKIYCQHRYPALYITSKITDFKYWEDGYTYQGYDENLTQSLTLDTLNDESIIDVSNADVPGKDYWYDWNLISHYTSDYIENYISSMRSVLGKDVSVKVDGHDDLGTGDHQLSLLKTSKGLLNYHQAMMLEVIEKSKITIDSSNIYVSRGMKSEENFNLPVETFKVTEPLPT